MGEGGWEAAGKFAGRKRPERELPPEPSVTADRTSAVQTSEAQSMASTLIYPAPRPARLHAAGSTSEGRVGVRVDADPQPKGLLSLAAKVHLSS